MHALPTRFNTNALQARRLTHHYYQTIGRRSNEEHDELCDLFAIAFRPGDRTGNFLDKGLRPLGMAVMTVLSYGRSPDDPRRRLMPLRGFKAEPEPDGALTFGIRSEALFLFNGAMRPTAKAFGVALNPHRNASITELMQRMDRCCFRNLAHKNFLPVIPHLPRVLLGFAPESPPAYEDTPALRRLAAEKLEIPIERLSSNSTVLLDRLLRDLWEQLLISPDAIGNTTGGLLVDAEFCTDMRGVLRFYEDFRHLLGMHVWNPARSLTPFQMQNPALQVLQDVGIDVRSDFSQAIDNDKLAAVELAMRQALGPAAGDFTTDEIYDAIVSPDSPVTAWAKSLCELRSNLNPGISECVSDEDLLRAARRPCDPLVASGACRIQVLQRRSPVDSEAFAFSGEDFARRIEADLWGTHPAQRHFASDYLIAQQSS
jgi:hypothetical protein